jgi:hypothetical protein
MLTIARLGRAGTIVAFPAASSSLGRPACRDSTGRAIIPEARNPRP